MNYIIYCPTIIGPENPVKGLQESYQQACPQRYQAPFQFAEVHSSLDLLPEGYWTGFQSILY